MVLRLIDSVKGNSAFEHIIDGVVRECIVGQKCVFDGNTVTWGWGFYNLTKEQALKKLEKLS